MTFNMKWGGEEGALVRKSLEEGLTLAEIATRLKRSQNSVWGYMRRNDLRSNASLSAKKRESRRKSLMPPEERQRARELLKSGLEVRQVAEILGRTCRFIYAHVWMPKSKSIRVVNNKKTTIPAHVIEDRDRRYAEEITLNMALFGDPSPRRSALGRPCE